METANQTLEAKQYIEVTGGNIGISTKDTSSFHAGDDMDNYILDCIVPKNREAVEKYYFNTKGIKEAVNLKVAKILGLKRTASADELLQRREMMKSLEKQKRVKKERIIHLLEDVSLDEQPIDITDEILEEPEVSIPVEVDEVVKSQLINNLNKPLETYNEAQLINVFNQRSNRFGKVYTTETSNTYLGRAISKVPMTTFGAIGDFDIDSLPLSLVKCKGTVITWMSSDKKTFQGLQLISRRFISKVIQFWSYIVDLGGNTKTSNYRRALELWSIPIYNHITKRNCQMVNGDLVISMLKDILFLIRNKEVNPDKISLNLYNIIRSRSYETKNDFNSILEGMKERLFFTRQLGENVWNYSIVHPDYLVHLLKELRNGEYETDILVPAIIDLYKYPIECKDTHVKTMTEEQHEKNIDDYDIGQYIFERE